MTNSISGKKYQTSRPLPPIPETKQPSEQRRESGVGAENLSAIIPQTEVSRLPQLPPSQTTGQEALQTSGEQSTPDASPKKTPLDIMNRRAEAKRLRRSTATAGLPKLPIASTVNAPPSATLEVAVEQGGVSSERSSRASPGLSPSARRIPEFIRHGTHRGREQRPSQFKQKTETRQETLSLEELAAVLGEFDQECDQDEPVLQSERDKK